MTFCTVLSTAVAQSKTVLYPLYMPKDCMQSCTDLCKQDTKYHKRVVLCRKYQPEDKIFSDACTHPLFQYFFGRAD